MNLNFSGRMLANGELVKMSFQIQEGEPDPLPVGEHQPVCTNTLYRKHRIGTRNSQGPNPQPVFGQSTGRDV
jgi:hypothetical protein